MSELTLFENEIEGSKIVNCQSYAGKNLVFVSNMEYKRTFKYLAHEMIEPQVGNVSRDTIEKYIQSQG